MGIRGFGVGRPIRSGILKENLIKMSVVTSSAGIGPGYWDNYRAGFMVGIVLVLWLRRYFLV